MKYRFAFLLFLIVVFISSSFDIPKGWFKAGASPEEYEMGIDSGSGQDGGNAATIKSKKNNASSWATLMQDFYPGKFLGKKVKMSAYMKTKDLTNKAAFWMRVDQMGTRTSLSFDNMSNRPVKGTTDWTKYEIVLNVPYKASNIAYGAMLNGSGQIWFDNFSFEIADSLVQDTEIRNKNSRQNPEPFYVDFEK